MALCSALKQTAMPTNNRITHTAIVHGAWLMTDTRICPHSGLPTRECECHATDETSPFYQFNHAKTQAERDAASERVRVLVCEQCK
jgi:hypothetical protein